MNTAARPAPAGVLDCSVYAGGLAAGMMELFG